MEEMSAFFTRRVEGYDEHMLQNVAGCAEGYELLAQNLLENAEDVLDLGCGTGLELDAMLAERPDLRVTGIDLTQAMLDELKKKHPEANLCLICGDYFQTDFGSECFDCAVSFESLHHFSREKKLGLYRRICEALRPGGVFLNGDYMVESEEEERVLMDECARLRKEQGIPEDVFVHFDTPLAVDAEIELLKHAGFACVEELWRQGNTTLLRAVR